MALLSLCQGEHPVLRRAAQPIAAFTDEIRRLGRDMIETMYAHEGIGLAAPQVGLDIQMFVANPSQQRGREVIVVNPQMERMSGRASIVEGCLSLPDVWERVKRATCVQMSGRDVSGAPLTLEAEGLLAIVLQHEFDHLQGRLFIDRLPWFHRRRFGRVRATQG